MTRHKLTWTAKDDCSECKGDGFSIGRYVCECVVVEGRHAPDMPLTPGLKIKLRNGTDGTVVGMTADMRNVAMKNTLTGFIEFPEVTDVQYSEVEKPRCSAPEPAEPCPRRWTYYFCAACQLSVDPIELPYTASPEGKPSFCMACLKAREELSVTAWESLERVLFVLPPGERNLIRQFYEARSKWPPKKS